MLQCPVVRCCQIWSIARPHWHLGVGVQRPLPQTATKVRRMKNSVFCSFVFSFVGCSLLAWLDLTSIHFYPFLLSICQGLGSSMATHSMKKLTMSLVDFGWRETCQSVACSWFSSIMVRLRPHGTRKNTEEVSPCTLAKQRDETGWRAGHSRPNGQQRSATIQH